MLTKESRNTTTPGQPIAQRHFPVFLLFIPRPRLMRKIDTFSARMSPEIFQQHLSLRRHLQYSLERYFCRRFPHHDLKIARHDLPAHVHRVESGRPLISTTTVGVPVSKTAWTKSSCTPDRSRLATSCPSPSVGLPWPTFSLRVIRLIRSLIRSSTGRFGSR